MSAAALLGALFDLLERIGRALTVDLVGNLDELRGLVCALVERCMRRCRLPNRLDRKTPFKCVPISDPAYKKPDPLIYAQYYLMEQGLAVTWDNPDITLVEGGVPVPSHSIVPNTDYEVVAR